MPLALAQITPDYLVARLQHDLPGVMVAAVLLAAGLGAMVLYRMRERNRDRALLWFGIFGLLYSVRLLLSTWSIQLALGSRGEYLRISN